jgi:F-type H+-transporting ATPase subunit epsilon
MKLQILTPDKIVYDGEVEALLVPGAAGPFEILKDHAPILSSLVPGELRIKKDRKETFFSVSGGFLEFHKNQAVVLAEAAETPEEIDTKRVAAAKQKALDDINNPAADRTAAQKALARALARERISERVRKS